MKRKKGKKNPKNSSKPKRESPIPNESWFIKNQEESDNHGDRCDHKEQHKEQCKIPERDYQYEIEANKIAGRQFYINMVVAAITFLLFLFTATQTYLTRESVNSLKEQFALENRPFLKLVELKNIIFKPGEPFATDFTVINMGKYPTEVIRTKTCLIVDSLRWNFGQVRRVFKNKIESIPDIGGFTSVYVSSEPSLMYQQNEAINTKLYQDVVDSKKMIYWGIEITYADRITKTEYRMKSVVHLPPTGEASIIFNDPD